MDENWQTSEDTYRYLARRFRFTPFRSVEFRLLDWVSLAKKSSSCWKNRNLWLYRKPFIQIFSIAIWTDVLRILLLEVYGGIWIDADTFSLIDFRHFARSVKNAIALGGQANDEGRRDVYMDLHRHVSNNNILLAWDLSARRQAAAVSCRIDYKVDLGQEELLPDSNLTSKEVQIKLPTLSDGKPVHIYYNWFWNDGLMKLCTLSATCPMRPLPIAFTDPDWAEFDLLEKCESMEFWPAPWNSPTLETSLVVAGGRSFPKAFASALRQEESITTPAVLHHRSSSSCRTNAAPRGQIRDWLDSMRVATGLDPRAVATYPLPWLHFDVYSQTDATALIGGQSKSFLTIFFWTHTKGPDYLLGVRAQLWSYYRAGGPMSPPVRFFFVPAIRPGELSMWNRVAGQYKDVLVVGPVTTKPLQLRKGELVDGQLVLYKTQRLRFDDGRVLVNDKTRDAERYGRFGSTHDIGGRGILSSELEMGLMKWAQNFNTDFAIFLNMENIAINIEKLRKLTTTLADRVAEGYNPHEMTSAGLLMAMHVDSGNSAEELPEISHGLKLKSRTAVELPSAGNKIDSTGLPISKKPVVMHTKLSDACIFFNEEFMGGYIASRNMFPFLLSPDNPILRLIDMNLRRVLLPPDFSLAASKNYGLYDPRLILSPVQVETLFPQNFQREFRDEFPQRKSKLPDLHPLLGKLQPTFQAESFKVNAEIIFPPPTDLLSFDEIEIILNKEWLPKNLLEKSGGAFLKKDDDEALEVWLQIVDADFLGLRLAHHLHANITSGMPKLLETTLGITDVTLSRHAKEYENLVEEEESHVSIYKSLSSPN